mgnify:CR=1 FL=1
MPVAAYAEVVKTERAACQQDPEDLSGVAARASKGFELGRCSEQTQS